MNRINSYGKNDVKPIFFSSNTFTTSETDRKKIKQEGDNKNKNEKIEILVVEDDLLNQKIARHLLEGEGYKVDIAKDGKEALTLATTYAYNLILMDYDLPDMKGTEITKQLRQQEFDTHVPIIACTANDASYKAICLEAGMDDFINKPIKIADLKGLLIKYRQQ